MNNKKKYYAFISYSHKDEEWAKWLQHEFEHYHLPTTLNGLADVPDKFRPIFRDVDELSGGELKPQIAQALRASAYLVVVCSPNSAKSPYVDGEIREFISIGEENGSNNVSNIFPLIIDGVPHSNEDPGKECFPEALRTLESEVIAGDATKHGREHAFVKILSGTLHHSGIGFGMLWNQFERDRIEAERKEREKRDKLLLLESRYLSEKALDIAPIDSRLAKKLVLRALPEKLDDPEDRPYCLEAESAMRTICIYKSAIFDVHELGVDRLELDTDGRRGVSTSSDGMIRIWNMETGSPIGEPLKGHSERPSHAIYSHDGKIIASCSKGGNILLWDAEKRERLHTINGAPDGVRRVVFTHNDKLIISTSCSPDNEGKVSTLALWSVEDGRLIREIHVPSFNDMAIDQGDRWIALAVWTTVSDGFSIAVYDLNEGEMIKEIPRAHSESLSSIDFSPDGKRIVSGACDGKFKIWDWMKGEEVLNKDAGKVKGAYAPVVTSSKFSPDGRFVVTASADGLIRLWNAATGEPQGKPLSGHAGSVRSAVFSKDGRCIISDGLDGSVRIWDLKPQAPCKIAGRAKYIPFESEDYKSASSPDGRLLAKASGNKLKVFDAKGELQIGPDLNFFDDFYRIMFSKNGRAIIAETEKDYDVEFDWEPLQDLIDRTREQVKNRDFSEAEKKRYYLE